MGWLLVSLLAGVSLTGCAAWQGADRSVLGEDCDVGPAGFVPYRKAVAVSTFSIESGAGGGDLWGVGGLFAQRVADNLEASGQVRVQAVDEPPLGLPERATAITVRETGHRLAAQFVVSGRFLDLSVSEPAAELPWLDSRRIAIGQRRRLQVQLEVHDAVDGGLIGRHQYEVMVAGENRQRNGRLGHGFWQSRYGTAMEEAAASLAEDALGSMLCEPLTVPVQHVDGARILVEAGALDGLQRGDDLRVVATNEYRPSDRAQPLTGFRPIGMARVESVSPRHAVLVLEPEAAAMVRIGDLVRAW